MTWHEHGNVNFEVPHRVVLYRYPIPWFSGDQCGYCWLFNYLGYAPSKQYLLVPWVRGQYKLAGEPGQRIITFPSILESPTQRKMRDFTTVTILTLLLASTRTLAVSTCDTGSWKCCQLVETMVRFAPTIFLGWFHKLIVVDRWELSINASFRTTITRYGKYWESRPLQLIQTDS